MTSTVIKRASIALLLVGGTAVCLAVLTHGAARSASPSLPASVTNQFGILASAATPSDALPSEAGFAATTSRRIATGKSSLNEWIATKADQLCVLANGAAADEPDVSTASFACGPPEANYTQELLVLSKSAYQVPAGQQPGGPDVLIGLAPNETQTVTITYADHTTETVAVMDNGWHAAAAGRKPAELSWTTSSGTHVEDMTKA
jgi:hypothetical protein